MHYHVESGYHPIADGEFERTEGRRHRQLPNPLTSNITDVKLLTKGAPIGNAHIAFRMSHLIAIGIVAISLAASVDSAAQAVSPADVFASASRSVVFIVTVGPQSKYFGQGSGVVVKREMVVTKRVARRRRGGCVLPRRILCRLVPLIG